MSSTPTRVGPAPPLEVGVLVVGAGFAGLYSLFRLRKAFQSEAGLSNVRFIGLEAGSGVGGTWFWNRYPGARCDIQSLDYSFSFDDALQQEWNWSERYSPQPQLLAYLNHVADRFDLRKDIYFNTRVTSAIYDDEKKRWTVQTDQGDTISTQFLLMATGCLSTPQSVEFKGMENFKGSVYYTSSWPHHQVDFNGKRVGVIGTGSSGIQTITSLSKDEVGVQSLTVFQRTPCFSVPAWNCPLDQKVEQEVKASYSEWRRKAREAPAAIMPDEPSMGLSTEFTREERTKAIQRRWDGASGTGRANALAILGTFSDISTNKEMNDEVCEFFRQKIRSVVKDPVIAETLCPKTYPIGTKRLCVDTGYYQVYNKPNVQLVDISKDPIEEVVENGIRTSTRNYELDALILATGFDAMTRTLLKIDIRGSEGLSLRTKWAQGPVNYLGLQIAGFPNLFTVTGPLSPSVLTNMVPSIEQHVDWITDCIAFTLRNHGNAAAVEATPDAEAAWVEHSQSLANMTLYPGAKSWYTGANIDGKPTSIFMVYMGGFPAYGKKIAEVAANNFEGFKFSTASTSKL